MEGYTPPSDADASVSYHRILPGFFQAAGIRVLEGRSPSWNEPDAAGSVSVVVNRAMARRYWPGQSALGRHLHLGSSGGNATWMTVRGVVGDVRQVSPGIPPEPQLYLPYTRTPSGFQVLVARTGGDPATLVAPMRRILAELAPDLPARRSGTLASHVAQSLVTPRFYALILATLAGMALVLALVGVYGTMAYAVRTRTRELGVRMALGAGRGRVRAMVLGRGMRMAVAGVVLGLLLALGWTRLLASLVYGVSPDDPVTLAAAGVAVTVAAVLASWIPAMRATRVDPARALRAD